jgi:serine/threonine-protein kinase HipA
LHDQETRTGPDRAFLLIERYDRARARDGQVDRLHQEDFCQALSIPPELKYEEEGGPGAERSIDLINRACYRPAADRLRFIRMLLLHDLVGNADANGNYALLYQSNTPDLAPLYDVDCTAGYPKLSKKLAMYIGSQAVPDTIQLKHWLSLVPDTKAAQRLLINDIDGMAGSIERETNGLPLELSEAGIQHPILRVVRGVIATRAAHLLRIIDKV